MKTYCEDCRHMWRRKHFGPMAAKCLASPAEREEYLYHDKPRKGLNPDRFYFCTTINKRGECKDFECIRCRRGVR